MKNIKVLSLFDGISCARVALDKAGIEVEKYYASEIDKYAIQISQKNYHNIEHTGSVTEVKNIYGEIDLLIGGSPCQDLSIAKKDRKGLEGERSGLFYEYVRILNEVKPKYFILENVASMSKEAKETITKELFGIEPVMINAALVSAQNRKRLFWVGKLDEFGTYKQVDIPQPEDKGILLKDILEENVDEKYFLTEKSIRHIQRDTYGAKGKILETNTEKTPTLQAAAGTGGGNCLTIRIGEIGKGGQGDRIYSPDGKSVNLSANGGGRGAKTGLYLQDTQIRKLTPVECERLQGLPDNYTEGISNTQRYKTLGNAFNADVVAHIIKQIDF